MPRKKTAVALSLWLFVQGFYASVFAASGGELEGRVPRAPDSQPVAGVLVETGEKTTSNAQGANSFDLPPGVNTLVAAPPGAAPIQRRVAVASAKTVREDLSFGSDMSALDQIVVLAQRTPISVAREAQFEAPNLLNITTYEEIRKIPDVSVAEAVRRIPGISLETDEGEGRYVNCRGLDADLNSTTFGGLRLPPTNNASPFGGYRAVTLDSIPIGLVGAITVTKSNLPSQDAEALGCTIEITPKTAPQSGAPFIQGNLGGGYEPLRGTPIIDVAVTAGGRFGGSGKPSDSDVNAYSDRPFSVVLTATYYDDKRGFDDVEPAYYDDTAKGAVPASGGHPYDAINNIDFRDYELHRKRHGYGIDLGYQPNADHSWYLRAFDAGYTELYGRPYLHLIMDGNTVQNANGSISDTLNNPGAIRKNLRDERETSRDRVFVLGGKNILDGNILDYRVGYTKGTYDKFFDVNSRYDYQQPPGSNIATTYNLGGAGHSPNIAITGANYLDPTQYQLVGANNSTGMNFDKEVSFATNFDMPTHWIGVDAEDLKVGASARLRKKRTTVNTLSYPNIPGPTPVLLSDVASSGPETYYDNRYPIGVDIAPGYLQYHFGTGVKAPAPSPTALSPDIISDLQQYLDAKENVYALYGQYLLRNGPFELVSGVRVEHTTDKSNAFQVQKTFDTTDPLNPIETDTVTPVTASKSYTNWFPGMQAKYEIQPKLITRATWSTTLARPGFNQSNVAKTIDYGSGQIVVGNPNLKPSTANSFDVTIEKYLANAGILSLGLFDKEFKNYIVPDQTGTANGIGGLPLRIFTFNNLDKAHARERNSTGSSGSPACLAFWQAWARARITRSSIRASKYAGVSFRLCRPLLRTPGMSRVSTKNTD